MGQCQHEPRVAPGQPLPTQRTGLGPLAGPTLASIQQILRNGGWHRQHFYTSVIGRWGSHTFAQCHDALGIQDTSQPLSVRADPTADGMEMPFANGVTMIQKQEGWRGTCGIRYVGEAGAHAPTAMRAEVSNPAMLADYNKICQTT